MDRLHAGDHIQRRQRRLEGWQWGNSSGSGGNAGSSGSGGGSGGANSGGSSGSGGGSGGANSGGSGGGSGGANSGGSSGGGSGGANSGGSSGSGGGSGGANSGGASGSGSGGANSGGSGGGGGGSGGANSGGSGGGSGGDSVGGGAGGSGGTAGAGGSGSGGSGAGGTETTCPIVWDWEGTTADNWSTSDTDVTLAVSTTQKFTGTQALKATIPALTSALSDAGATTAVRTITITPPTAASNMWPGAAITVHVWVPTGTTNAWLQLIMLANNWAFSNSAQVIATAGDWTTVTWTVPAFASVFPGGINQFGVQFGVSGGNSFAGGDIFIDSITVCGGTQSCSGTTTGSFDFETAGSTDGWAFHASATTITDTVTTQSTTQHFGTTGTGALKAAMTAVPASTATAETDRVVELSGPQVFCGQTVTYHVFADVTGLSVQPYVLAYGYVFTGGTIVPLATVNTWTTVTFTVPAALNFLGVQAMGLQFANTSTTATYTGNVYIDGISWQ